MTLGWIVIGPFILGQTLTKTSPATMLQLAQHCEGSSECINDKRAARISWVCKQWSSPRRDTASVQERRTCLASRNVSAAGILVLVRILVCNVFGDWTRVQYKSFSLI